jgi:hypothetical protein
MAARLVARDVEIQRGRALDAVAQAVCFPAWHHLSTHLAKVNSVEPGPLPAGWLDAISGAAFLAIQPDDDVPLPTGMVQMFERFGESLAMLLDAPKQGLLNGVSAVLCGGRLWDEVRSRTPLTSKTPLYHFNVFELGNDDFVSGAYGSTSACDQLSSELDLKWELYPSADNKGKRATIAWLESVLAAQPGFLEGGRALAWMERDAGEAKALKTATSFVRAAEALIPKGFKGRIEWGHLGNRVYHRLLWLQMDLLHECGQSIAATKVCRRMLRLNPSDNAGARYVLPFLLLEHGQINGAKHALRALKEHPGLTASVARAFVAFSEGNTPVFRRELATALFTLPAIRVILTNDPNALPDGDDGFRGQQPDMESFSKFAWPSYLLTTGLRRACLSFLAEQAVIDAETCLRIYWAGFWNARRDITRTRGGTIEGWRRLVQECVGEVALRTVYEHSDLRSGLA